MGEFKTGAVRLAVEMTEELGYNVPIVPCAVLGSRNALPKGKLIMKPAKVTVRVGKPFYYDEHINNFSYPEAKKLAAELHEEVSSLVDGSYKIDENDVKSELSIGSPSDMVKKSSSNNPLKILKRLGIDLLKLWDDAWYAMLNAAEVFNLRDFIGELIYNTSGEFVQFLSNLMMPYRTLDYESNLPSVEEGGAIICSNHNSEWDVIILATSFQQRKHYVHQMAKDSLHRIPIVNAWVRSCRAFPLARGEHDVGSYNYARERLSMGDKVIIYPEGTTNSGGGNLLPGHTGAMRLAIEAKVPIILVGITGTEDVFPKHAKMLNFHKGVYLKMGEPFLEHKKYWGKEMPSYEELQRLTNNMMKRIKELLLYDSPDA